MKHDYFSPELTTQSMHFEIGLFIFSLVVFVYGIKNYRFFLWRYFALFFGVICFEILTSSLWLIEHLGKPGYINGDISIVMSLLWTNVIITARFLYEKFSQKHNLKKEFAYVICISTFAGLSLVGFLKMIGVFGYGKEILQIVNSGTLIFDIPLEAIVYFPIFIFTVYSFYKYWELAMYDKKIFENFSIKFGKDIFIASAVIFGIGYLLHPLLIVENVTTYVYLILSFVVILIVTNGIIILNAYLSLFPRFLLGTTIFAISASIVFSYFIESKLITLSESMKNTYTDKTILIPGLHITDAEFAGLFIMSYLIIAVVKYFKIVTETKKIVFDDKKMTFKGWKSLFSNK